MIPAAFDYVRADSADEAITPHRRARRRRQVPRRRPLPAAADEAAPGPAGVLVDIGRLSDLSYIRDAGDHIAIGALTRHRDVETLRPAQAEHVPLLAHAAGHVGDPQVRHRGTIGGSIAHADPASDLPATTLALGAHATSPRARTATREIAAGDFFTGLPRVGAGARRAAHRDPGARRWPGAGWSFQKFNRRAQDWAIVGVAAWRRNGDSRRRRWSTWARRRSSPPAWSTRSPAGASVADAAEQAADDAEPQADLNASVEYRTHLAKVLVRRALEEASA